MLHGVLDGHLSHLKDKPITSAELNQQERRLNEIVAFLVSSGGAGGDKRQGSAQSVPKESRKNPADSGVASCTNAAADLGTQQAQQSHHERPEKLVELYEKLSSILQTTCPGQQIPQEGMTWCRYFTALLKALHCTQQQVTLSRVHHNCAFLVMTLQKFWTYGWAVHEASEVHRPILAAVSNAKSQTSYRPPHRRKPINQAGAWGAGVSGSDTDGSDTENSSEMAMYGKARLEALHCLHGLAVKDAQMLHASWLGILPVYSVQSRSLRDATLIDLILRDPVVKVRTMAAATMQRLLEGSPQRAFLAIAEQEEPHRHPVRGFTTLSLSLGGMVVNCHKGLVQALAQETRSPALLQTLAALQTLIKGTNYKRLQPGLAASTLKDLAGALQPRLSDPESGVSRSSGVLAELISCIGSLLLKKEVSKELLSVLASDSAPLCSPLSLEETPRKDRRTVCDFFTSIAPRKDLGTAWHAPASTAAKDDLRESGALMLVADLIQSSISGPAPTVNEALIALRYLCDNLSDVAMKHSKALLDLAILHITHITEKASQEQEVHGMHAYRLLASLLAADSASHKQMSSEDVLEATQQACSANLPNTNSGKVGSIGFLRDVRAALDCDCKLVIEGIEHSSGQIRAAATTLLGSILDSQSFDATAETRQQLIRGFLDGLASENISAVRCAAAVALNSMLQRPGQNAGAAFRSGVLNPCWNALLKLMKDDAQSVRIQASVTFSSASEALLEAKVQANDESASADLASDAYAFLQAAMGLASDVEKVSINVLRGVGALTIAALPEGIHELPGVMLSLQRQLENGSNKAKWNVLHILHRLLSDEPLARRLYQAKSFHAMCETVVRITTASVNSKCQLAALKFLEILRVEELPQTVLVDLSTHLRSASAAEGTAFFQSLMRNSVTSADSEVETSRNLDLQVWERLSKLLASVSQCLAQQQIGRHK